MNKRVRVVTSFLVQGQPIDARVIGEDPVGITVRDERGVEMFLPWTSVGYVIRNPEHADATPEPF